MRLSVFMSALWVFAVAISATEDSAEVCGDDGTTIRPRTRRLGTQRYVQWSPTARATTPLRRFEPHLLPRGVRDQVLGVEHVLGQAGAHAAQRAVVHDRPEHHAVHRELL